MKINDGSNIHDSEKPVELMKTLITNSSMEGEIILDPFMGSGSTAIDDCDYVVFLNYGRERTTAGCSWEAGYAFASGKKVFVVDIPHPHLHEPDPEYKVPQFITSLMIENGRYATINGLDGLCNYDWEKLKKTRTKYEQK